jgi:hypothetical protein
MQCRDCWITTELSWEIGWGWEGEGGGACSNPPIHGFQASSPFMQAASVTNYAKTILY